MGRPQPELLSLFASDSDSPVVETRVLNMHHNFLLLFRLKSVACLLP